MSRYFVAVSTEVGFVLLPTTAESQSEATRLIVNEIHRDPTFAVIHVNGQVDMAPRPERLVLLDVGSVQVDDETELRRLLADDLLLHAIYHLGRQQGYLEAEERLG